VFLTNLEKKNRKRGKKHGRLLSCGTGRGEEKPAAAALALIISSIREGEGGIGQEQPRPGCFTQRLREGRRG